MGDLCAECHKNSQFPGRMLFGYVFSRQHAWVTWSCMLFQIQLSHIMQL